MIGAVFREVGERARTLSERLELEPEEKVKLYDSLCSAMSDMEYWALADPELVTTETRLAKIVEAIERHHLQRADIIQRVFGGHWSCVT
jgi:hypothetical protein